MKIPENAKLVFKGVIFDTYQWEQEVFDGTYMTFEAVKRPDTVQVIAVQNDKIIIAKEKQPTKPTFYGLFGGRVEPGEKPEEAIKREFLEESGFSSKNWTLFKTVEPLHKLEWFVHYFIAKDCQQTAEPKLDPGEKVEEILKLSFDEFIDLIISEKIKDRLLVNEVLKMKVQNRLEDFKKILFG